MAWRIGALAFALAALTPVVPVPSPVPGPCTALDRTLMVDVNVQLIHAAIQRVDDSGPWAVARGPAHITMWKIGKGRYCARITANAKFKTVAGASPNGTGTVPDGLPGLARFTSYVFLTDAEGGFTTDYARATGSAGQWDCLDAFVSDCVNDGMNTSYFEWGFEPTEGPFETSFTTKHNGRLVWSESDVTGDIAG